MHFSFKMIIFCSVCSVTTTVTRQLVHNRFVTIWTSSFAYYSLVLSYIHFFYSLILPGNREGKIFIWELQSSPPVLLARFSYLSDTISMHFHCMRFLICWVTLFRLSHPQSKSPIRQTATSFDGRYFFKHWCCCS